MKTETRAALAVAIAASVVASTARAATPTPSVPAEGTSGSAGGGHSKARVPCGVDVSPATGLFKVVFQGQTEDVPFTTRDGPGMVVRRDDEDARGIATELVGLRLHGDSTLVGPIEVEVGRQFGLPASPGRILPPVPADREAKPPVLIPPYRSFFDVFYVVDVPRLQTRVTEGSPISLTLTQQAGSAFVELGGVGRPPPPVPLCVFVLAAIEAWRSDDPEVRDRATTAACTTLRREKQRIRDQVIAEEGILAYAVFVVGQPSRGEVRQAELEDESCVFQVLREAAAFDPDAEVRSRARDVLDRCGQE